MRRFVLYVDMDAYTERVTSRLALESPRQLLHITENS